MMCLALQVTPPFATKGSLRLIFWERHKVRSHLTFILWELNLSGCLRPGTKSLLEILSLSCWLPVYFCSVCSLQQCSLSAISHCQHYQKRSQQHPSSADMGLCPAQVRQLLWQSLGRVMAKRGKVWGCGVTLSNWKS